MGAALALTALLVAAPAQAASGDGGDILVSVNGHAWSDLTNATLQQHVIAPVASTELDNDGEEYSVFAGGVTAAELLTLANIPLTPGLQLGIPQIDGRTVTLDEDEIANGFSNDPRIPGVHWATFDPNYSPTAIRFFRPMRGPGDRNGADRVTSADRGTLDVSVTTSTPLLTVTASADPTTVPVDATVTFTASSAVQGVTYAWDFGDGSTLRTGTPALHPYTTPGNFEAVVTAIAPDGSTGTAAVDVSVGTPAPTTTTTPAPTTPAPTAAGGAGSRASVGTAKPTAGTLGARRGRGMATNPARHATPRTSADSRDDDAGTKRSATKTTATTPAATTPTPARSTAAPTPTVAAPPPAPAPPRPLTVPRPRRASGTSRSGVGAATTQEQPPRASRSPSDIASLPHVSGLELVSAGVDADAIARAESDEPARAAAQAAARRAGGDSGAVAWWLLGGLAVAALLGAGGLREAGVRRPAWVRLPTRQHSAP